MNLKRAREGGPPDVVGAKAQGVDSSVTLIKYRAQRELAWPASRGKYLRASNNFLYSDQYLILVIVIRKAV